MSGLPGNPRALAERADAYINAAKLIDQAADDLRRLAFQSTSRAVDKLQTKSNEVATELDEAHGRYNGTAYALKEYSVTLQHLHDSVDAAEEDQARANLQHARTEYESTRVEHQLKRAEADPATPTSVIQQLQRTVEQFDRQSSAQQAAADAAQARIAQAQKELNEAAARAIAKIDTAIKGTNEGFWDSVKKFVEDVGSFFASVWNKVVEIIKSVVDAIVKALVIITKALIIALLIIVAIAVLAALIYALLPLLMAALSAIAAVLLSPAFWLLVAAGTALVSTLLARTVEKELATPPERHKDLDKTFDRGADDRSAPRSYGDLFRDEDQIDTNGGSTKTDIRVIKILGPNGDVIGWRVELPSTQNWDPDNRGGALNDVSADGILSGAPGVETQYERAVWDALGRAGALESGAPIMLSGWSLGGMMAAHVAADPRISARVESVVVGGSPIDKYRHVLGPQVRVTSFENSFDIVPHLEFAGFGARDLATPPNWRIVTGFDPTSHHNGLYGPLADRAVGGELRPGDEKFFVSAASGTREQVHDYFYSRSDDPAGSDDGGDAIR